jgi:hypothetical protein
MTLKKMGTSERLAFLDILRIFAFVSVLIGHKFYDVLDNLSKNEASHLTIRALVDIVKTACWGGGAGVVVFFLISGYIITLVLETENTKTFLIKRIFRIYPLFISAVVLEAIFGHLLNGTPYPAISIWIPRLLLIGDFFGTPYALSGVEWTLRIEVLFYAVMAALKYAGLIRNSRFLPLVYLLIVVLLQIAKPFPHHQGFGYGFVTLYLPFLFFGSCIFLMERKKISSELGFFCITYIFFSYLHFDSIISPGGKESHFAALACTIFFVLWLIRLNLKEYLLIAFLSELTYSVYLFHNWLWTPIQSAIKNYSIFESHQRLQALFFLFLFCYLVHVIIEKQGISLGKKVLGFK